MTKTSQKKTSSDNKELRLPLSLTQYLESNST